MTRKKDDLPPAPAEPLGPGPIEQGRPLENSELPPLPPPPPEPPDPEPIRRRRRRRKPTEEAQQPPVTGSPLSDQEKVLVRAGCILVVHFVGRFAVKRWGPEVALDGTEETELGEAWAAALEQYLDSVTAKMTPLGAALLCTVMVALPRIMVVAQRPDDRAPNPPGTTIEARVEP